MAQSQRVIPLSRIQWQVIEENAPDEGPQSLDLVCDPVERQTFKLAAINLLTRPSQAVKDSYRVVVRMQASRVRELLLRDEYYDAKDGSLRKLGLHQYFGRLLNRSASIAIRPTSFLRVEILDDVALEASYAVFDHLQLCALLLLLFLSLAVTS